MKNVIKKVSAIAMAFTLLGTGSVVTKKVAPKSDNTLKAYAYMPPQYCNHSYGRHMVYVVVGPYIVNSYWCCNACGSPV